MMKFRCKSDIIALKIRALTWNHGYTHETQTVKHESKTKKASDQIMAYKKVYDDAAVPTGGARH
jgi:hypothetical protein